MCGINLVATIGGFSGMKVSHILPINYRLSMSLVILALYLFVTGLVDAEKAGVVQVVHIHYYSVAGMAVWVARQCIVERGG